MARELTNVFGKVFLTVTVDTERNIIHANWKGYLSEANVKAGSLALSDTVKETGISCILADMLGILGPISSTNWAATEWALLAAEAGLKHMALLRTPGAIANTDVSNFHSTQTNFQSAVFSYPAEAMKWLIRQCSTPVTF